MNKNLQIILVAVLLAAHIALGLAAIRAQSPTYDEALHLVAGYSCLRANDYRINIQDNPPFARMWAALPLMYLNPLLPVSHPYWRHIGAKQYPFSSLFLYNNRVDPEKMLNLGRMMILILSASLGLLIFFCSKEMFGPLSGFFAMALWCFMPTALANGSVVTTDMAFALFSFSTIYVFKIIFTENETGKNPGVVKIILLGVSAGLLFASKYSAAWILPVLLIQIFYLFLKNKREAANMIKGVCFASVIAFITLLIVYRFNSFGSFVFNGLQLVIRKTHAGQSSFLIGQHSDTGWIYYFPVTFVLKTPIPFIALLAITVFFKKSWTREMVLFMLMPAAVFFAFSCLSKIQIGHRHILPVYPFLIVWVSGLASYAADKYFKCMMAALIVLFAASSVRVHPWYISYFNEFITSPDEGYKYLTDSNLDWGQGLKALGIYLKEQNIEGIYLCYFGTGDPSYYGIKYVPVGFVDSISPPYTEHERAGDNINLSSLKNMLFAISATNLQSTYYDDKNSFDFLKEIKPQKIIAHSIFVYNLTANPQVSEKFKKLINKKWNITMFNW